MKKRKFAPNKLWVAGILLSSVHLASHAVDAAYVTISGGKKAEKIALGLQWNWDAKWFESNGNHVSGYWDPDVGRWHGSDHFTLHGTQIMREIGITPIFRWQKDSKLGFYGEAGIGARLISAHWNNAARQLITRFQFGDTLAVGTVFNNGWDAALKLEHISNAGIKTPNSGMNFLGVRANYHF